MLFRIAGPTDAHVLREMLYQAVFVPPGATPPPRSIVTQPELRRYVDGWGRPGDDGIIAVAPEGEPIGAAWLRVWPGDDRGYGFIDPLTPELSVAVRPEARGRGIGTALLRRLLQRADASYERVSLSVSILNPAVHLYERLGFTSISVAGTSMIMERRAST